MEPDRDDNARKSAAKDNPSTSADGERVPAGASRPIIAASDDSASETPAQPSFAPSDDEPSSAAQGIGVGDLLADDRDAPREDSPIPDVLPPDLTDLSDPVFAFEVSMSTEDGPEASFSTDTAGHGLSEERVNELIRLIEDGIAAREASTETASPETLAGIVLRVADAADSTAAEAPAAPPAADRQELEARRVDEASRDIDRFAGGLFRRPEPAGDAPAGTDRGSVLPRVIVVVELANARAIMDEDRRETAEEMAAMLREIAVAAVKQGFWEYGNERRAADYRLRGPSW